MNATHLDYTRMTLDEARFAWEHALGPNATTAGNLLLVALDCWRRRVINNDEFDTIVTDVGLDLLEQGAGKGD